MMKPDPAFSADDHGYMARALQLAGRGLYSTEPNPRVGCVLVDDGEIVGEGWHRRAGEGHAEVNAIADAGDRARGATAYVTLEPCCHHGKTPPCSEALIEAGVARVVAAMVDPNPRVAGQGLAQLEAAGIAVQSGLMAAMAEQVNPGFVQRMRSGRPFVRSKIAMSMDGRTAMASGESKWITGDEARADVQRLRARSSAILTGIGTVLVDDPHMNVRGDETVFPAESLAIGIPDPLRVVMDTQLRISPAARMLALPGRTLVLTGVDDVARHEPLVAAGATVHVVPDSRQGIDPLAALEALAALEVNEVLLEAGATLNGAMLSAGLIDELVLYVAPHIMGNDARAIFNLPGLAQMADRVELDIGDIRKVGRDLRITARVKG